MHPRRSTYFLASLSRASSSCDMEVLLPGRHASKLHVQESCHCVKAKSIDGDAHKHQLRLWSNWCSIISSMCMSPLPLLSEKTPLLGLQFISSPPQRQPGPTRRSKPTPTRRLQERMQNERRQLLYVSLLVLAALFLTAPILCIIEESANLLFSSSGNGSGTADKSFHHSSPLLRQSSSSAPPTHKEELSASSPTLSPTNDQNKMSTSTVSSPNGIQMKTSSPNATSFH